MIYASRYDGITGTKFAFPLNEKLDNTYESVFQHWTTGNVRLLFLIEENKQGEPYNHPSLMSGGIFQATVQGNETQQEPRILNELCRQRSVFSETKGIKFVRQESAALGEMAPELQKALLNFLAKY